MATRMALVACLAGVMAMPATAGQGPSAFAPVAVAASPVTVSLELTRAKVTTGSTTGLKVRITNISASIVTDVVGSLAVDSGGIHVGAASAPISIAPGKVKSVTVQICALEPGMYVVVGLATWRSGAVQGVSESPGKVLEARGRHVTACR